MRRGVWLALGLVATGAAVAAKAASTARAPSARVDAGVVADRIIARAVVGLVDGVAEVRARTEGRALRVLVREGDAVHTGDVLAELESGSLRAELDRREAERDALAATARAVAEGARPEERAAAAADAQAAQHDLDLAEDRAARAARLRQAGSTSDQDARQADGAVSVARDRVATADARLRLSRAGGRAAEIRAAQARVAAAAAAVALAREDVRRTLLVAPVDGVVLARRVDPGDTVTAGSAAAPLFELGDLARRELRIEIEERDAPRLAAGLPVAITTPGGREVLVRVTLARLGARLERRTIGADDARVRADGRVRPAWAALPAADTADLAVGQPLEAVLELPARRVTARVPRGAVAVREGRAVVDVPWGPWTRERAIFLGAADDRFVEVRGISVGTTVLIH